MKVQNCKINCRSATRRIVCVWITSNALVKVTLNCLFTVCVQASCNTADSSAVLFTFSALTLSLCWIPNTKKETGSDSMPQMPAANMFANMLWVMRVSQRNLLLDLPAQKVVVHFRLSHLVAVVINVPRSVLYCVFVPSFKLRVASGDGLPCKAAVF